MMNTVLFNQIHNCKNAVVTSDPSMYDYCSVRDFGLQVIRVLLLVGTFLCIFYIVMAGYNYLQAFGNEEKAKKAKDTFYYAVVGTVIILIVYVAVNWGMGYITDRSAPANQNPHSTIPIPSP